MSDILRLLRIMADPIRSYDVIVSAVVGTVDPEDGVGVLPESGWHAPHSAGLEDGEDNAGAAAGVLSSELRPPPAVGTDDEVPESLDSAPVDVGHEGEFSPDARIRRIADLARRALASDGADDRIYSYNTCAAAEGWGGVPVGEGSIEGGRETGVRMPAGAGDAGALPDVPSDLDSPKPLTDEDMREYEEFRAGPSRRNRSETRPASRGRRSTEDTE